MRPRVVTYEDRAQAGRPTRCGQSRHSFLQVDEDFVARDFAVQRDRTHVLQFGMAASRAC
jgi:hypothetical protein